MIRYAAGETKIVKGIVLLKKSGFFARRRRFFLKLTKNAKPGHAGNYPKLLYIIIIIRTIYTDLPQLAKDIKNYLSIGDKLEL